MGFAGRSALVAVSTLLLSAAPAAGWAAPPDATPAADLPAALITAVGRDLGIDAQEYLRRADLAQRLAVFATQAGQRYPGAVTAIRLDRAGHAVATIRPGADAARGAARQAGFQVADPAPTPPFSAPAPTGADLVSVPLAGTATGAPTSQTTGGEVYASRAEQSAHRGLKCSWAFNAVDRDGRPAALTAGHCNAAALAGRAVTGDQLTYQFLPDHKLGAPTGAFERSVVDGIRDYSIVRITDSARESFRNNLVRADSSTIAITGVAVPVVGAPVCKSGATTGFTCGIVTAVDQPDPQRPPIRFKHTALSLPGDSGGAIISGTAAMGIVSEGGVYSDPSQFPTDRPDLLPPGLPGLPINLSTILDQIGPHALEEASPLADQFLRAVPQITMIAQTVADVLTENPGLQVRTS
jgi:hypothetical protein